MVCLNFEGDSEEVRTPGSERVNDGKQLLFTYRRVSPGLAAPPGQGATKPLRASAGTNTQPQAINPPPKPRTARRGKARGGGGGWR